jgi:O-Antigen ligase
MNNAPAIPKSLVIYAICLPLAILVGYLLTNPLDYSTFAYAGVLALVLSFPLLLRWHYPLLLFSLNASVVLFFIKGQPNLWLVMVALSLGLSLLERALGGQKRFIRVPQTSWPLICLLGVVFLTASLAGGIGLRAFGSDVYGGKKYIFLVMSIVSYFALTAQRIPPERANLYLALFLLGGVTGFVGDLYPVTPPSLQYIFWVFPPSGGLSDEFVVGVTRLPGTAGAAEAVVFWMMARYGLRGVFLSGKLWRPVLFVLASMMIFLGGYRLAIISYLCVFGLLFFLERLHRTRAMPVFVIAGMLLAVAIIPFASRLPFTFQRALAFLPLNLSAEAKAEADFSVQWRVEMWGALLPQVPSHLLLGEGYVITMTDFQMMGAGTAFKSVDPAQQALALAHDFHNGPLSVVLPFGIWGVIALLWFMLAGLWVVYRNFRHGDESLRTINTYLWVSLLYASFKFIFLYGALNSDMLAFVGTIGFSIALNGGVCRPEVKVDADWDTDLAERRMAECVDTK